MASLPCRKNIISGFGRGEIWCRLFRNTHNCFPISRNRVGPSRPGAPGELGAVKRPTSPASYGDPRVPGNIGTSMSSPIPLLAALGDPVRLSISSEQVFNLQKTIVALRFGFLGSVCLGFFNKGLLLWEKVWRGAWSLLWGLFPAFREKTCKTNTLVS